MAMNKLWRRALGMLKDKNMLWVTRMVRRSRHRNPCLEVAIIKATNHDDTLLDYKNARVVFTWVRASPSLLLIFLRTLTRRVERTKDWSVALKCLMLLHGVLCTKAPGTRRIGRLPFDLSTFQDAYTSSQLHPKNAFVRAYFAFSNAKSMVMADELKEETEMRTEEDFEKVRSKLVRVQRWQDLMDHVLQVKPDHGSGMMTELLVVEAMDCMIIEVFELYSKICNGIAKALMKISTDGVSIEDATLAFEVLQKAARQSHELMNYFEFCNKIGILHDNECPKIDQIPEEEFIELERIINQTSPEPTMAYSKEIHIEDNKGKPDQLKLKTVITDKWVVFDEDIIKVGIENDKNGNVMEKEKEPIMIYSIAPSYNNFPPLIQFNPFVDYGGIPSQLIVSLS